MRIVQIIDSLEVGGAERMAVNYANALSEKIEFSGLIATRKEGLLLDHVKKNVSYLCLKKTKRIDFKALFKLNKYLKNNKVEVIHAHSSSFFIALLVKLIMPNIKIIWHDHYGISQDLASRKNYILKFGSIFFLGTIAVNDALKKWAVTYLNCLNVTYFPNFINKSDLLSDSLQLKGEFGKRIICIANLRPQKNHELLIDGAVILNEKFPNWTFHLVGKDFNDLYSARLNEKVKDLNLSKKVFFYGAVNNTHSILEQCNIAVLTSFSEGLPLAVLEYGMHNLPVVATNVGEIPKIIPSEKVGLIIESDNLTQFVVSVQKLIEDEKARKEMGKNLHSYVEQNFSEESVLNDYITWLKSLIT